MAATAPTAITRTVLRTLEAIGRQRPLIPKILIRIHEGLADTAFELVDVVRLFADALAFEFGVRWGAWAGEV